MPSGDSMTKKEIKQEEERVMLNRLIVEMNGRQMALKSQLEDFDRDYKKLKKKLDKHFEKYGINEQSEETL